jgi:hypothetical protein
MLNEKNLPYYFWAKVVAIVIYIMNQTPTTAVHGMTPEEKFTSKKPNVSHFIMLVTFHMCMFLMRKDQN